MSPGESRLGRFDAPNSCSSSHPARQPTMARNSKHDLSDDEGSSPDPYDLALASAPKRPRVESSSAPQPTASTSKSKEGMQADESEEEMEEVQDEEEDRRVEEAVENMRQRVKKRGVRPPSLLGCATPWN